MSTPETSTERHAVDAIRVIFGLGGLIALIVGILILVNPLKSGAIALQVTAVILAVYMVGAGVVSLGTAIFSKTLSGWARTGNIVLGALYVIAGIVVMANLAASAAFLALFAAIAIGIMWLFEGIFALSTLKKSGNSAWTIIFAIISILAGFSLMLTPIWGAVYLWIFGGVSLVILGVIQIVRAFKVKAVEAE